MEMTLIWTSSIAFRSWVLGEGSGDDCLLEEGVTSLMGESSRCAMLLVVTMPILAGDGEDGVSGDSPRTTTFLLIGGPPATILAGEGDDGVSGES